MQVDVGGEPEAVGPCGCDRDFIWIANAGEGTVSKIDTRTLEEVGRYITRPDGNGNPSRTSVNLAGDVAVANRHGGLTKIVADPDACTDTNGVPGIQTSTGARDVLAWGMDDCVDWYTEFPTTNQRPVAWATSPFEEGSCEVSSDSVWTVYSSSTGLAPGLGGTGGVGVALVDGDTGVIQEEVEIAEADFSGAQLGAYGGAVDPSGDLFFVHMGAVTTNPRLARVTRDDLTVSTWDVPASLSPYGITVDHLGRVWVSSTTGVGVGRFDPALETWDLGPAFSSLGGLAQAGSSMWIATAQGAVSIDLETLALGATFESFDPTKGIAVDIEGFVWVVGEVAYKIDAATGESVGSYDGLTEPYTYSDMTGTALATVTCGPG